MKYSFIIAAFLLITVVACSKDKDNNNNADCNCTAANQVCAVIVKVAANCDTYGIEVKGVQYASSNIPAQFQVVGTRVCAEYTIYEDLRLCPSCCGGFWADIISMNLSN